MERTQDTRCSGILALIGHHQPWLTFTEIWLLLFPASRHQGGSSSSQVQHALPSSAIWSLPPATVPSLGSPNLSSGWNIQVQANGGTSGKGESGMSSTGVSPSQEARNRCRRGDVPVFSGFAGMEWMQHTRCSKPGNRCRAAPIRPATGTSSSWEIEKLQEKRVHALQEPPPAPTSRQFPSPPSGPCHPSSRAALSQRMEQSRQMRARIQQEPPSARTSMQWPPLPSSLCLQPQHLSLSRAAPICPRWGGVISVTMETLLFIY